MSGSKILTHEGAQVRSIAERVAAACGLELLDVQIDGEPGNLKVRVIADRPEGIGLADLQAMSEEMSVVLDAEDPISSRYTLEVSSPGLDRPLYSEADYQRFQGRLAHITSREPVDGRQQWTGRILEIAGGEVRLSLESEGGRQVAVPIALISAGRLKVEFPDTRAGSRGKGARPAQRAARRKHA